MNQRDAQIAFRLLSINRIGTAKIRQLLKLCREYETSLEKLICDDSMRKFLVNVIPFEKVLEACLPIRTDEAVKNAVKGNVQFLSLNDESYPDSLLETLQDTAPPILCLRGNISLLNEPGFGFCGSRHASERGKAVAQDCAEQLAQNNVVVISGNAIGIDTAAHIAVLAAGGRTIIVLPEGINRFPLREGIADVWDWNRVLVVSEFEPDAIWSRYRAMSRNRTIIGLSLAMIVIQAGVKGGTIDAGKQALSLRKPLFAASYAGMPDFAPGNETLIQMGAFPFMRNESTNCASIGNMLEIVDKYYGNHRSQPLPKQSSLF